MENNAPMHLSSGYIRLKPGTKHVAMLSAHNLGVTMIEEGEVHDQKVTLTTTHIGRMSFAKDPAVTKVNRSFHLVDGKLVYVMSMETTNQPLQEHLRCTYTKVDTEQD